MCLLKKEQVYHWLFFFCRVGGGGGGELGTIFPRSRFIKTIISRALTPLFGNGAGAFRIGKK